LRDEDSTTYTGAIETAESFGSRIYREAWDRGWDRAKTKVILGDGAVWIWNIADEHFPGAIQIVDLYHARQHLWELAARLFSADDKQRKVWASRLEKQLDKGNVESVVKSIRPAAADSQIHHPWPS
jgi:transposase